MKRLIIDLDGTLCRTVNSDYQNAVPMPQVVEQLRAYKAQGFEIVIHTARNMRTHSNSIGKITAKTVPVILDWLERHQIPFDEIHVGKPWCGTDGFYVDDKSIRPSEFATMSYEAITALLAREDTFD